MPTQFNTLCQEATLYEAWNYVKSKGSAGGIDGVTIQEFEKDKRRQIPKLAEELTNKIGTALEEDGYNTEFLSLWTSVPSMKGLPFWDFQKYKQTLETILEEEVEPLIQKVANKGILVLLLSPHFFEFDEQWANMFMTKMAFILKRHNCLYVSVRLAYPLTDENLKEINKSIYRISLDQANKVLIKTDNI